MDVCLQISLLGTVFTSIQHHLANENAVVKQLSLNEYVKLPVMPTDLNSSFTVPCMAIPGSASVTDLVPTRPCSPFTDAQSTSNRRHYMDVCLQISLLGTVFTSIQHHLANENAVVE
jgi:hypothetical protein